MDDQMEKTGLFYVCFMDDCIVLSPNRWKLKKAIQIVNQTLNELKVEKHPDKTFIGRIAKGFDFLGYSFEPKGRGINYTAILNQKAPSTPLQGCGALISSLTRLLNHSVKIGHIPIYIGIEWDFVLCELIIRWTLSFHNSLRSKY